MIKLNTLDALELARRLQHREITARSLLEDCIERIAARDPEVRAWAFFDAALARERARALDQGPVRGPLHGLPVGVKDVFNTFDMPTEYGSPIYRGHRPAFDSACVALARRAGALVLGKTVTTEFATFPPPKTRNPHDPAHTPGGSSSGSAAGVADFMMPLAFGSQTAGSVIRPAAFCGVVGYKPFYNVIARGGAMLGSDTLDTIGVLARSVADAGLFVGALTRRTELMEHGVPDNAPRVAICRTHEWDRALPESLDTLKNTAAALSKAGARVGETALPASFSGMLAAQATIMSYEIACNRACEYNRHPELLHPMLRESVEKGFAVPITEYQAALALAARCRTELPKVFGDFDVLLAPSAPGEAPDTSTTGAPVMNSVWTLLYVPCVTVPAGKGPKGLPVGVQIIGRPNEDARTLADARWIEQRLRRA